MEGVTSEPFLVTLVKAAATLFVLGVAVVVMMFVIAVGVALYDRAKGWDR